MAVKFLKYVDANHLMTIPVWHALLYGVIKNFFQLQLCKRASRLCDIPTFYFRVGCVHICIILCCVQCDVHRQHVTTKF